MSALIRRIKICKIISYNRDVHGDFIS